MRPRTKKIVKYSIITAIFAALLLFFYRIWKKVRNGATSVSHSVKDGSIVMTPNKEGTYEKTLIKKSGELRKAVDAYSDELNEWTSSIRKMNNSDWFTRLITFNFTRKK